MSSFMEDWAERVRTRHALEAEQGLHDAACEHRDNGHYLCHCSKRKREADGYTEPPEALIFSNPTCPRCYTETEHDGDNYGCTACKVTWSDPNEPATFTDEYGDLDPTPWDERAAAAAATA